MEVVQVSNLWSSSKIKVNTMNSSVKTKPVQCLGLFFIYSKKQMQDLSGHKKGEQKPVQLQRYFLVLKDNRIRSLHMLRDTKFITQASLSLYCCFWQLFVWTVVFITFPSKKIPKGKTLKLLISGKHVVKIKKKKKTTKNDSPNKRKVCLSYFIHLCICPGSSDS